MSRSRTRRSPRLDELRLAMPEERFEAGLVFGRHADRVGELKALVHFRDGQDAGSAPVAVATRKASVCAGVELAPPVDD
jgi:hypothetical protein